MTEPLVPVVLAAGKGTRMNSDIPKVLHTCFGEPMLVHVLRALDRASFDEPLLVLGEGRETVEETIQADYRKVVQDEQLGTGHAVQCALKERELASDRSLLVTCGDIPGLSPDTLREFAEAYRNSNADLMLLTTNVDDPEGYGRVKLDSDQSVAEIVEEADASEKEKSINRINTGVMCGKVQVFESYLSDLDADNEQGELYLTDIVKLMREDNAPVAHHSIDDTWQVTGINTRRQLVDFERKGYRRRVDDLFDRGVTVHDPDKVKVGPWVDVEGDVELAGTVTVIGESKLNRGTTIRGDSLIVESEIGAESEIVSSTIKSSRLGDEVRVGPYTHIRPDCTVGENVRVGNFVEMKKATVGDNSNVSHLSYIGDAELGKDVNVGAGTITCNYDGSEKYRTIVRDRVFIGSNVEIVAPVEIGENATIGAGSTITDDVPPDGLGIGRDRQKNIENWD